MKIVVDRSMCGVLGNCEAIAPHFSEVGEDGDQYADIHAGERAVFENVIVAWPTAALNLLDEG
jgi:ferredoxin